MSVGCAGVYTRFITMFLSILYELFYRPFFNGLFFIYERAAFHDLGLAIIVLTVIVRLILFPVFHRSVKNQTIMQKLQPKIKDLQAAHKGDREKQTQALLALYKEHNVNPFSGFLLIFVQLPVFIGLYKVFSQKFTEESFKALYFFVDNPGNINTSLLGLINLYDSSIVLVVLAALFQFLQGYYSLPKTEVNKSERELSAMERASRQMVYMGPVITLVIFWRLPSAIALYWTVSSLFSFIQQLIINRKLK